MNQFLSFLSGSIIHMLLEIPAELCLFYHHGADEMPEFMKEEIIEFNNEWRNRNK